MISIYIPHIPTDIFSVKSSDIDGKTLRLGLTFLVSFSATSGHASFLLNEPFKSSDGEYVLNHKYLTTPLNFKIGPLLIASS